MINIQLPKKLDCVKMSYLDDLYDGNHNYYYDDNHFYYFAFSEINLEIQKTQFDLIYAYCYYIALEYMDYQCLGCFYPENFITNEIDKVIDNMPVKNVIRERSEYIYNSMEDLS